jgi:hypothetical protein
MLMIRVSYSIPFGVRNTKQNVHLTKDLYSRFNGNVGAQAYVMHTTDNLYKIKVLYSRTIVNNLIKSRYSLYF